MKYEEFGRITLRIFINNMDTQEHVEVHMYGFHSVQSDNYAAGDSITRNEVEARVKKLKNKKTAYKDEVMGEIIKDGAVKVGD